MNTPEPPVQLKYAAYLVGAEALALLAAALVVLYKTVFGSPADVLAALLEAGMAVLAGFVLAMLARGLLLLRAGVLGPLVLAQLLALPVSYSLAFQAGLPVYGLPIGLGALAVLYLLFTPESRASLDREL